MEIRKEIISSFMILLILALSVSSAFAGCATSCEPTKVSSDVAILIENSIFTGVDGLQKISNFISSAFEPFNVKTSSNTDEFKVLAGIRTYSDWYQVVKPFGSVSSDDLNYLKLSAASSNQTNLQTAFREAERDFGAYNNRATLHRPNAARTIVIFATNFVFPNHEVYDYPSKDISDFIATGGKVLVYVLEKPGMNSIYLQNLTSSVYTISSSDPNAVKKFQTALCEANCVCPFGSVSHLLDPNTNIPTDGCYAVGSTSVNYGVASNRCKGKGGYVAEANSNDKSAFLSSSVEGKTFLQGLSWDQIAQEWMWVDGSALNSTYAPWAHDSSHTSGMDCVTVAGGKWQQADCKGSYPYVCEILPCDTNRTC